MSTVIGIIQARMGSSRLPGKILAPLASRPLLEVLYARVRPARVLEWWLATTSEAADDVTEHWGHSLGMRVFRGASDDVLSRFVALIGARNPEWVLRVTADNPFTDSAVIDWLIDARDTVGKNADLIEIAPGAGLPMGYAPQLARAEAVLRCAAEIPPEQAYHRTHVLSWIDAIAHVPAPPQWPARPDWRWTVDTFDDLAMARSAFERFGYASSTIDYPQMVAALEDAPEIAALNRHVRQKELADG